MEPSQTTRVAKQGLFSRHKFAIGVGIFVAGAAADVYMTITGTAGDLQLEGNPIMRWVMAQFGHQTGLLIQKATVGTAAAFIAAFGERAIKNREKWIEKVPSTKWARAWMARKDRSWIAYLPLYIVAMAQGFAAVGWIALGILY